MPSILAEVRSLVSGVEGLLLPASCLGCGSALPAGAEPGCCAVCRSRMRRPAAPACARCGQPRDVWDVDRVASACGFCAAWPAELAWAASAAWMDAGPATNLVHGLKYQGWRVAARPMAELMQRWLRAALAEADVLVPVPLGAGRLRRRGYNQAAVLAEALGRVSGVPVVDVLRRTRETRTQTALGPTERWGNVAGAFSAEGRAIGTRVALVDDVLTTGATVAACAAALAAVGVVRIGAVTFARAAVPN